MSVILGSKKISKSALRNSFYSLGEAFNLVGQRVRGEGWECLKASHLSFDVLAILEDLARYRFFSLCSFDVKSSLIREVADNEVKSVFDKDGYDALLKKYRRRDREVYSADGDVNFVLPQNFFIDKEQLNYVLKTGKNWFDRNPNPRFNGLVISEKHTTFPVGAIRGIDTVSFEPMMFIGATKNLCSYQEIAATFREKFGAEKWEVKFLINRAHNEMKSLRDSYIDDSGYAFLYQEPLGSPDYTRTYYLKSQVDKFEPKIRFITYQSLLSKWEEEYGIDESEAAGYISGHLDFLQVQKLFEREWVFDVTAPKNKDSMQGFYDDSRESDKKFLFIKNAVFGNDYLAAIEGKYRFSKVTKALDLKQDSSRNLSKPVIQTDPPQIQKIRKNAYLDFQKFGDLLGYARYGSEWNFDEIPNNTWRIFRDGNDNRFLTSFYKNNIQLSHLENEYDEFFHCQNFSTLYCWEFKGRRFIYLEQCISYKLLLSIIAQQKKFRTINEIPENYLRELDRDCFHFVSGKDFIKSTHLYKSGFAEKGIEIANEIFIFAEKLNSARSHDEYRKAFLNIEKSEIKKLYDLLIYAKNLNDPITREINAHLGQTGCKFYIPETYTVKTLNELFESRYEEVMRFISVKQSIYQAIKNRELEIFVKTNNAYHLAENFDEKDLNQDENFFLNKRSEGNLYIKNNDYSQAKKTVFSAETTRSSNSTKKIELTHEEDDKKLNFRLRLSDGSVATISDPVKGEYSSVVENLFAKPTVKIEITDSQHDYFYKKFKDNLPRKFKKKNLSIDIDKFFKLSTKSVSRKHITLLLTSLER